jgi:hypothetical protein
MPSEDPSRDELFKQYTTGVWTFLIVAAAMIFSVILWVGYVVFL